MNSEMKEQVYKSQRLTEVLIKRKFVLGINPHLIQVRLRGLDLRKTYQTN